MKGEQRSGWSPVRYLEKECRPREGGHTSCILVSRLAQNTGGIHSQTSNGAQCPGRGRSGSVISAEVKRKQKPKAGGNKTVAHSTSCQREGGVWFPPTSYGSWAGKLKSLCPTARQSG